MRLSFMMRGVSVVLSVLGFLQPPRMAIGQVGGPAQDSIPAYRMEEIVVTADRMENPISHTTAAVSVMRADEMRRLPFTTFSDVFQVLPGFFVSDRDGLGRDPIINTRGFYGGGEAEYLLVLLDGRPINDLETGLVNWNLVPLGEIEAVEVVRGASSPLYGDAALGGVINIRTSPADSVKSVLSMDGGSFGIVDFGLKKRGMIGRDMYQAYASHERTDGFRAHSMWQGTVFGGDVTVLSRGSSTVRLSSVNQWMKADMPGPLTAEELSRDRNASSPYYRADGKEEKRAEVNLTYSARISQGAEFTADLLYGYRDADLIRTFANPSPIIDLETSMMVGLYDTSLYGDTKGRRLRGNEGGMRLKYALTNDAGRLDYRFIAGLDGNYGRIGSTYYPYFAGFAEDYRSGTPTRGNSLVEGIGRRAKYALYLSNDVRLDPWTLTMGVRYDAIDDTYEGTFPDTSITSSATSVSPKFGFNVRLADRPGYSGTIFGNVNRSFKAPTLDQLTDRRPVGFAGFMRIPTGPDSYTYSLFRSEAAPFSNAFLKPQTALSYEMGTYQRLRISGRLCGEASLSVYQLDMKDEIDFDLASYRYQNIMRSRHRGIESSVRLYWTPRLTAFVNYTWTSVTLRSGPYTGNYLKGIPRDVVSLGGTYEHRIGLRASLTWTIQNKVYLDDENSRMLPRISTGDVRISQTLSPFVVFVNVANVLDAEYCSNGYMLYQTEYLYPSAGRVIHGGISVDF